MVDFNRAIVKILSAKDRPDAKGTGFFVTQAGHVLTCYHVISKLKEIWLTCKSLEEPVQAVLLPEWSDEGKDFALLEVVLPSSSSIELLNLGTNWDRHDSIFSQGFQYSGYDDGHPASGVITGDTTRDGNKLLVLENATHVQGGISGAPAWNLSNNRVLGIVTLKWAPMNTAYVTPLAEIAKVLRTRDNTEPIQRLSKLEETFSAGPREVSMPLQMTGECHSNLPAAVNSFVGREQEITEVKEFLAVCRLVTLTGPGGVGKSRLALQVAGEVAEQYADGVWLAELAALSDPSLVVQAVASVLGVREVAGAALAQTLASQLKPRTLLLVLDNCEHLLEACGRLCDGLLSACPQVRVLATSRERLGITGEQIFPVQSLATPDPTAMPPFENLTRMEAVRLFQDRAAAAQPSFSITPENASAVAQVCWRLDGIPLAIELAAARVSSLSVEEVSTRLDDRFRLLTGGSRTALPRHKTLRALVEWSYGLLSDHEKTVFQRLAAFAGGWTLEGAEAVCAGEPVADRDVLDLLTALVDKSLVVAESLGDGTRYRLLETVREYAQERLTEAVEEHDVRTKHLAWCMRLAEQAELEHTGPDQVKWLNRLENEHDNLRGALNWCYNKVELVQQGVGLVAALGRFWDVHGHWSEGRRSIKRQLSHNPSPSVILAKAMNWAGALAQHQGDYVESEDLHSKSLVIYNQLEHSTDKEVKDGIADCLIYLGNLASDKGDYESAKNLYERCLAICQDLEDEKGIAYCLNNFGKLAHIQGDYEKARDFFQQSLVVQRGIGFQQGIALVSSNLGNIATVFGEYEKARDLFQESLDIYQQLGNQRGVVSCINRFGDLARAQGDDAKALSLYQQSLTILTELGDREGIGFCLLQQAALADSQGNNEAAWELYEQCLALYRQLNVKPNIALCLNNMANIAIDFGGYEMALNFYQESLSIYQHLGNPNRVADCIYNLETTARKYCTSGKMQEIYKFCLKINGQLGYTQGITNSLHALATLDCDLDQFTRGTCLLGATEALRQNIGDSISLDERMVEAAHAALGQDAFTAAWDAGRAMTLEQAVEYALSDEE